MISLGKMRKTLKTSGIGVILLLFFLLNNGFGQNTIKISNKDTTTLNDIPEQVESIMQKYKARKSQKEISLDEEDKSIDLGGLIIDETISKVGQDFYRYFNNQWNAPGTSKNFNIYISEKPTPGMGNMIIIKINYEEIFKNRISPQQQVIESLVEYAINQSQQYIMNYEKIKKQLEGEDMSGTGIY